MLVCSLQITPTKRTHIHFSLFTLELSNCNQYLFASKQSLGSRNVSFLYLLVDFFCIRHHLVRVFSLLFSCASCYDCQFNVKFKFWTFLFLAFVQFDQQLLWFGEMPIILRRYCTPSTTTTMSKKHRQYERQGKTATNHNTNMKSKLKLWFCYLSSWFFLALFLLPFSFSLNFKYCSDLIVFEESKNNMQSMMLVERKTHSYTNKAACIVGGNTITLYISIHKYIYQKKNIK